MHTSIQNTIYSKIISFKLLFVMLMFSAVSWGQFNINVGATNYTQNFNTLTSGAWANNSTLSGWYAKTTLTSSITTYGANTGSITTAGLYAFGVAGTNLLTDRALGYAPSNGYTGAAATGKGYVGWRIKNNTGSAISSITVTWTGEQWRKDNTLAHTLNLFYQSATTVTNLSNGTWASASSTFTTPQLLATAVALDGNAPTNRTSSITATITINIASGDEIMLRWEDLNDSGNDHFMAIDDVTVNATVTTPTPTISLTPAILTGFTYVVGSGPSAEQIFNASGTNLTADITINAPTNYEISTASGSGFLNTITLNHSSGTVSSTHIYVRLKAGLSVANYDSETIAATSGTASGSLTCSGSVIANVPEINIKQDTTNYLTTSTYAFGNVVQGANSQVTFTIENLGSANLTITCSTIVGAGFSITTNPVYPFSVSGTTTFGITFTPTGIGAFSGSVTIENNDSDESSYIIKFTGTGIPNTASDVSFNSTSAASTNTNIAYTSYQSTTITNTAGSIGVMGFYVRDGGARFNDADLLATELTGISFSVTNVSNIRSAALFNGNTLIKTVPVNGVSPIVFTSLSGSNVTCADNSQLALNLRVTFNQTVTDNQQMIFTVSAVTANASGSSFATSNGGGAISSSLGDTNRIEVTADRLAFVQQPTTTSINTVMAPSVTVAAEDIYSNRDLDYATAVSITSSGTLTGTPVSSTAISGLATFSNLTHTVIGTFFLTATSTGLVFSNTKVSSDFNITSIVYANNVWRTKTAGTWTSVSGVGNATWEQYSTSTGSWTYQAGSSPSSASAVVYIAHNVSIPTAGGSYANPNIYIQNGSTLTWSSSSPWTAGTMYVYNGGTLQINSAFYMQSGGNFEIEDGGKVNINYKYTAATASSRIWNGSEKFHPNSNIVVQDWNNANSDYFLPSTTDVTSYTNGSYSAPFGNLIVDMGNTASTANFTLFPTGYNNNLTHNNLIFRTSGSGGYNVRFTEGSFTNVTIGGNLTIENTFVNPITLVTVAGTSILNIKGNFTHSGTGNFRLCSSGAVATNITMNVVGDMTIDGSGANVNFNATSGSSTPTAIINLKGDFKVGSAAYIYNANVSKNGTFYFSGIGTGLSAAATQTIDIASGSGLGSRNQYIDFYTNTSAYVQLINQDLQLGINSSFTVNGSGNTGGTLDFNFNGTTALNIKSYNTGTSFSSLLAATLKISSPDGINNTSGTVGNVQTTNAPSYIQTATFWYNGKTNQVTGTGLSNGSSAKIVYVNLIDNTKTLTLTNKIGISGTTTLDVLGGKLEIQKGTVIGSTNLDFFGSGRLVMSDGEYKISTITTNPSTDYLPQLSNYANYSLTGGTINLSGTSATENQILSGTPTYYNLTFSGSNILGTNYKGLSSATNVINSITISETAVADAKSFSLGGSPNTPSFTMTGTSRYITDGGGTKPDAGGTYALGTTTTIEFANLSGAGVVRLGSPAINYAKVIVSGNNVSNTSTETGIKFQPNGTFTVKNTGNFKFKNTAGFTGSTSNAINNSNSPTVTLDLNSTVEYAGADQTVTNFDNYRNVTISGTGIKTNTNATFINEDLNVNGSKLLVNTNEVITVKQAVKIATTEAAEIEIKNNGQLIQIDEVDANSGTNFKVNRIATINKFDYVYWSSPVDNFDISSITGSYRYSWDTTFTNTNGTQGNWTTATGIMSKGKGYIVRAPNTFLVRPATATTLPISFLGKPNNGQFDFEIKRGIYDGPPIDRELSNPNNELTTEFDDNWNLLGNPYPSAIDAEAFLALNSDKIQGAVWIWKHGTAPNSSTDPFYQNYSNNYSSSDYLVYNRLGTSEPNTFNGKIASGQGFMVNMLDSAGLTNTVTFQNSLRAATHDNSNFYRNAATTEEKSRIWLNIVNSTSGKANTTLVGYSTNSTLGEDYLYDCVFIPEGELAIYSLLNANPFVIQGRGLPFDSNDTVPLGMKIMANGNHIIAINSVDGLFESTPIGIYLEDRLLNIVHDLRQSPYLFTANIGRIDDRFVLRYSNQELGNPSFEAVADAVFIANNKNQISIQSSMKAIESVTVYDVLGRLLLKKSNIKNNTFLINNLTLSNQTLIVKIVLENGQTVTKKIVF